MTFDLSQSQCQSRMICKSQSQNQSQVI